MQRIDRELERRGLTWPALREALGGASKQSVTNWRREGLPKKHYSKVDEFFGKPYGWAELGIEEAQSTSNNLALNPDRLHAILGSIAGMFRMLPEDEWADALVDVAATLQKRRHFR